MWGQYTSNKEANMYPKPIADLSGWDVRAMACSGKGWMVCADDTVIGAIPSPCYGELVSFLRPFICSRTSRRCIPFSTG